MTVTELIDALKGFEGGEKVVFSDWEGFLSEIDKILLDANGDCILKEN